MSDQDLQVCLDDPGVIADGTIEVFFGLNASETTERNWVSTNANKGFFLVLGFHGPKEGDIDKARVLNDLVLIDSP